MNAAANANWSFWTFRGVLEVVLWATGAVLIGSVIYNWSQAAYAQARGAGELVELATSSPQLEKDVAPEGFALGKIEIRRLDMAAIVFEGTSESTLIKGVGHLRGTAEPGDGNNNIVLAAHRDTFFRALKEIRTGDLIALSSPHRAARYQVTSTEVIEPTELRVAAPTNSPVLTLITCYPFSYFGSAPQRFVVRAQEIWTSEF